MRKPSVKIRGKKFRVKLNIVSKYIENCTETKVRGKLYIVSKYIESSRKIVLKLNIVSKVQS